MVIKSFPFNHILMHCYHLEPEMQLFFYPEHILSLACCLYMQFSGICKWTKMYSCRLCWKGGPWWFLQSATEVSKVGKNFIDNYFLFTYFLWFLDIDGLAIHIHICMQIVLVNFVVFTAVTYSSFQVTSWNRLIGQVQVHITWTKTSHMGMETIIANYQFIVKIS